MMKYLLLLALFGVLWLAWKKRAAPPPARPGRREENMVACGHCGLFVPEGDSVAAGPRRYCCEAHRQAGEAGRS